MIGKELSGCGRRPFALFLMLASMLVITAFGERALFAATTPQVSFKPPDVPPEVLIGEDFTFRVRFKNASTNPGDFGYGPFIDVVVDAGGANITKPAQTPACLCDGMTFLTASLIDVNGGPVPLVSYQSVASPCTSSLPVSPNHPFQSSGVPPVIVPAGSQLVTIELPFGSFDPTQPEIVVEVTAHMSNLADVTPAYPLKIYARGGFRYGSMDALDNPGVDPPVLSDVSANPTQWLANEQTTPTLMIVSKKYLGPEDETATGPNFIRRYEITLDVATLQTIHKLKVTDHLPNNVAYHQMISAPPCFLPPTLEPTPPNQANNSPDNDLVLTCDPITGVSGPDAIIVFEFFIPELDANGQPVLSSSCVFAQSINDVKAEGNWTPIDLLCDPPDHVVSDATATDHTLADKCLAIQKTVADISGLPPAHPIPGDTLQYTLDFQLSDFRTSGSLHVQDILSDGQTLLPASLMLTVIDQCGMTSGAIPPAAWTQTSLSCSAVAPPPRTELNIDVTAAMSMIATASGGPPRHQSGILTGGYATPLPSNVPATGTITFQTVIDDAYQCPVAFPHDQFVDKDDPLTNTVELTAAILPNGLPCPTIPTPPTSVIIAKDDSTADLLIATDFLEKTVYAVHRPNSTSPNVCGPNSTYTTTPCPSKPEVIPFDEVTFRLKKTIPSGDAENLTIQDWLPLPTFLVAGGPFDYSQCGLPPVGSICFGPLNTLTASNVPEYLPVGSTNSFTVNYGPTATNPTNQLSDPTNQPQTIDLLFTRVVTNIPFADGLYMTNEAQECESDTFGVIFCQTAIAQVQVREPALKITKGVVAAGNPNAVLSPPQVGPVTFQPPGASCPRFNGTIDSTNLASNPIDSDISNVDANDCITFAIVVENTGGSTAYDIELRDLFPLGPTDLPECFDPDFTTLCVTDGTGTPMPFTSGTAGHGNVAITLQNPLPGVSSTPGSNIAVITFDACVVGDIKPHCCDNTALVENYASTQGGPNFVAAGFGGPFQDSADVCVRPTAMKSIEITSEAHTSETPVPRPLAIGEIIRYRLEVVVPETTSPSSYGLQEFLPAGLSYIPGNTTVVTMSNGLTASNPTPLVTGGPFICPAGGDPLFDFGNVINTNNDAAQELIVLGFNALVCNGPSNQSGTALDNSFGVLVDGQQVATSNTVFAKVVEPNLTIAKTVSPNPVVQGGTVTYTVTITNNGAATAFDVAFTDTLPSGLTPVPTSLTSPSGWTGSINGQNVNVNCNSPACDVPAGGPALTITYQAVASPATCPVTLTNRARVTWTSLPGPQGTTTNPTGSVTPGNSGALDGERDGSTAPALLNDYAALTATPLVVSCTPCVPPPSGMVAWWPLDETSGTVVADIVGNNNGTPMLGSLPATIGVNGPHTVPAMVDNGLGLCFIPPSPALFVTVPDNAVLNFGTAQSFSIDAWINPAGNSPIIVDKLNLPNPAGGYRFYVSANRLKLNIGGTVFTGTTVVATGNWNHVAATVDRQSLLVTFYVNGTAEVVGGNTTSLNASSSGLNLLIGASYDPGLIGCEHTIDEIEIFDRALLPSEIQSIANAGSEGKCKCLLASNETIDCNPNGTFTDTFTVTNFSNSTVSGVTFSPPAGATITPGSITIPALPPGASTTVTVTISGSAAVPGTAFCFTVALVGQGVSCSIEHCITLPTCCFPPPSGMVSWWRAESNATDTADGNHGVLQGNAAFAPGMVGSAYSLAAQGDYVSVSNAANLNFGNAVTSPAFSIDAWIRTSSTAQVLPIVDKRDLSGGALGYSLFLFNGNLALQLGDGTFFNYISSGPDLRNGQFHHVAVTVDRTSPTGAKLYVDGALVSPVFNPMNRPGTLTNNRPLFIGRHANDPTSTFIGLIDEVEIFDRVLTQTEIQGISNAGPAGKCHARRRRVVRH